MRLWSINPQYLDRAGLVAVWREGLLAKKVLEGKTKGYKNHPQLKRFKESPEPLKNINLYLNGIYREAKKRGYAFRVDKIRLVKEMSPKITITDGQLKYEFQHLLGKLAKRDAGRYQELIGKRNIASHGLFQKVKGEVADWEKRHLD